MHPARSFFLSTKPDDTAQQAVQQAVPFTYTIRFNNDFKDYKFIVRKVSIT